MGRGRSCWAHLQQLPAAALSLNPVALPSLTVRPPLLARCSGYLVLGIPEGNYTLEARFFIRRSRTVVRGAGRGRTILSFPKSAAGSRKPPGGRCSSAPLPAWRCMPLVRRCAGQAGAAAALSASSPARPPYRCPYSRPS